MPCVRVAREIGGIALGQGNLISSNVSGIALTGSRIDGVQIQGNYIGTDATGTRGILNTTDGGIRFSSRDERQSSQAYLLPRTLVPPPALPI